MATDKNAVLSEERVTQNKRFRAALNELHRERPMMQISSLLVLLAVAEQPGKVIGDYAKDTGLGENLVSRNLMTLGPRERNGEEGMKLLEHKTEIHDMRAKRVFMTTKGRKFVNDIHDALEGLGGKVTL